MNNYYAVLGVLPDASPEEIKASYRQLAKRYHPDMRRGLHSGVFTGIREAYEVLSHPQRRRAYDEAWRRPLRAARRPEPVRPRSAPRAQAAPRPGAQAPVPILTRLMSIAVPRSGRFQLKGMIGTILVQPTTAANLWETTQRKFGDTEPERLARHVIQIKLSGERDLVKSMMPRPTDFGVAFQQASEAERKSRLRGLLESVFGNGSLGGLFRGKPFGLYGAYLPLTLQVTVPRGVSLHLHDVTGSITLGDLENEVVAKLLGGSLRTGRIRRAHITLNGASQAHLAAVDGPVDLIGFGESRAVVAGTIPRLRVVLENAARAQVRAPVGLLQAEVNGNGRLEIESTVERAQCDVRGTSLLRIARVTESLKGTRSRTARVVAVFPHRRISVAG